MESDSRNSLRMSDEDEEELKNYETSKGGSGKRRTTRNESEKRRRDKLNIYINELASMVPTCATSQKKLDKTTVLKMTVNYMRIHNDLTSSVLGKEYGLHMSFLSSGEISCLLDESLNGFIFVLSRIGEIVYMSQSITPLLGYEVDQIMGRNLIDFVHPEDKSIVLYELSGDNKDCIMQSDVNGLHRINSKPTRHSFDVRIECVSDKHFTDNQDPYEMVHVLGYTDIWETKKQSQDTIVSGCNAVTRRDQQGQAFTEKNRCLVAVGCLTRPGLKRFATVNESPPVEFESRHTMDGKFLFVDPRSITLTGFWPYELLGSSMYSYIHHEDMQMLASVHQLLLEYGECKTEPYRMRSKGDQWLWMKSRSFISYNHWNSKPEFFCSTNVAVCNKDGMESLRERKKASLCNPLHTSIVSIGSNSSLYPYQNQQQTSLMVPGLEVQQENVPVKRNAACKEVVPVMNDLSSSNVPPVNSANSLDGKHMSTVGSAESQRQSCEDEGDTESTESMDLTMSFEELENFIEAQGQLHDQLMTKHTLLEETITKQKQQLQSVQQQMLLNLQAQLTINPGANQELFEEQFKRTKKVSEMHERQETTQKELVQTLKERRRKTEKRNQRQLKYYLEKRMKVTNDTSSQPQATQATTLDMRTTVESANNIVNVTVLEEKRSMNSGALVHEHYNSAEIQRQGENIRERNEKEAPVPLLAPSRGTVQYPMVSRQDPKQANIYYASDGRQPVADSQLFSTASGIASSFIPQQEAAFRDFQTSQQPVYPSIQELVPQRRQQNFAACVEKTNLANSFPTGFSSGTRERPPSTLSNIQSLLTASSQNPESMQKLLSGLSSQPDVAQTLLGLLKQAQASGSSEQDSLSFDQSLQKTTNHFSSALGTDEHRNDNSQTMSYQFEDVQGLQKQQQSSLRGTSTVYARRNVGQHIQSRTRSSTASQFSTSTWSGSSGDPSAVGSSFLQHTGQTPRNQAIERRVNDKQKENKKDYFSNFSSQELEAMFLTSSSKAPDRTTAQSSNSIEEAKLREEQLLHSPLLIQQQQLLQMHQDQRRQLLVRQQEQLLMVNQKDNQTQQQMNVSFAENSQQGSLRSLLSDTNHPSTSTREQDQHASASNTSVAQPSGSWDSLSSNNFELNEADEQVLNMLLAESSMDTLLDPSPWPETDNLLDYLNMNPDLTSD
ncbi:circadian locomoter output cycles protein kaput-like [Actinia tenebrosa]|uniref:Circadian locomoter output cycles protein kaput-like n=1 Tax=Actinia tenebrosa TaxID=6105 RepID=A0A6P8H9C8_ACTTE|nr:circadian locomoter output cycles protein kaput-like [Actinia tenebrosa]